MAESKAAGLFGFCARSGNLRTGYNTCLALIGQRKVKLLVISEDVGEKSRDKMIAKCESQQVDYRVFGKAEDLSHWTGKNDKGLFAITDKGFAASILKEIDRLRSEREAKDGNEVI